MKTTKLKISELIMDFSIYPRVSVDSQHISYMRESEDAGYKLPPIVIDADSRRIIDGFHRVKMWLSKHGDNYKVECIAKKYSSEKEILLDSIRYNASHGRMLSRYDRTHCITIADRLHVPDDELASVLTIRIDTIGELRTGRIGQLNVGNTVIDIPLKRTIRHMAGRNLTEKQQAVNAQLGGMDQLFYVNQLIMLIESGLLNCSDKNLMEHLDYLSKLLVKGRKNRNIKRRCENGKRESQAHH